MVPMEAQGQLATIKFPLLGGVTCRCLGTSSKELRLCILKGHIVKALPYCEAEALFLSVGESYWGQDFNLGNLK